MAMLIQLCGQGMTLLAAQACVNMVLIMKCGLNETLSTRISHVDRLL